MASNVFIFWESNSNTLFLASKDQTLTLNFEHVTFSLPFHLKHGYDDSKTWIGWCLWKMDWMILWHGLVDSKIWIDWSCDMDWYIVKHQPIHVSIFCPYFKNLTEICDFDSIKSQFIPFCYFSSLLFWWHTTLNSDIIRKIRFYCNPQV